MDRDKMLDMLQSYAGTGVYRRVPVSREIYADAFTPIEVMRTLRAASRHCYLLESAEDRQQWGRYSFLGYAPVMEITCTDGHMTIAEGKEDEEKTIREFDTEDPGQVIREILARYKSPVIEGMPSFTGGLVGYFSYDYMKYQEPSLKPALEQNEQKEFRDVDLMLFDRVIVFDNYRQKLILIAGVSLEGDLEENLKSAETELTEMEKLIRSRAKAVFPPLSLEEEFSFGADQEAYGAMVEKAKEYVREGDIFQVVLSNPMTARARGSLFDTYGCSVQPIRPHICFIFPVMILKWQGLLRRLWQSWKTGKYTPFRWREPGPGERQRKKIWLLRRNSWLMKKNWRSIICW